MKFGEDGGGDAEYAFLMNAKVKALHDKNRKGLAQGPLLRRGMVIRNPSLCLVTLSCRPAVSAQ